MKQISSLMSLLIVSILLSCNNGNADSKNTEEAKDKKDTSVQDQPIKKDSTDVNFKKTLTLQGVTYDLTSTGKGSEQTLTITPSGLKGSNEKIVVNVDPITNAEIEDLDADGFPELLVYTQSAGSGSYGNVIGYSPNKGKSLSQIYFPELEKGSAAGKGYMGHDEFTIIENSLARRFKCYEGNDINAKPTGKLRQIQYKLVNGEASKKFVVKSMIDLPIK